MKKISVLFFVLSAAVSLRAEASPGFELGGALRNRQEYWKNTFDLSNQALDNRNFFRFRSQLWAKVNQAQCVSFYARLANEFRAYSYYAPSSSKDSGKTDKGYHFDINETVFDNLYSDLGDPKDTGVFLRLGRQDLLDYGEGFLLYDGTPGDGSRTYYFNALKSVLRFSDSNRLEFLYINDPRDDVLLPVINEGSFPQNLNSSDEEAYVLYFRSNPSDNLNAESYYIYKREGVDGSGLQAEKGRINTLGSFLKYSNAPYTIRLQLAGQSGKYGLRDRSGLGGYLFLDREFAESICKPVLTMGAVYLSGDDPKTDTVEAWDPLFSRYPWISELYGMVIKSESGINYYWTNLQIYNAAVKFNVTPKSLLTLKYSFLRANERVSSANAIFDPAGSRNRGHLPSLRFDHILSRDISVYTMAEYFIPAGFYSNDCDPALFFRAEMQLKF